MGSVWCQHLAGFLGNPVLMVCMCGGAATAGVAQLRNMLSIPVFVEITHGTYCVIHSTYYFRNYGGSWKS